jgi:hypothetical protein
VQRALRLYIGDPEICNGYHENDLWDPEASMERRGGGEMKKEIAVKINNEEEYNLAVEALASAGFRWHSGQKMDEAREYLTCMEHLFVSPRDSFDVDDRRFCVFWQVGYLDVIDTEATELLPLGEFVNLFSSMTEEDALAFCNSYFTESDDVIKEER